MVLFEKLQIDQNSEFMEDNLFLWAIECDEIISFFTGKGIYFHHSPHTPWYGYEDTGEHFYPDSYSEMVSCVTENLISEEKLYDVLDCAFSSCLEKNSSIDVFDNVILKTIYRIDKDKRYYFKKEWNYSQNLIDSIILYWRGKLKERDKLLQIKNRTEEIESQLEHIQQVQNFLNWFNENLMKGKLDEICNKLL